MRNQGMVRPYGCIRQLPTAQSGAKNARENVKLKEQVCFNFMIIMNLQ